MYISAYHNRRTAEVLVWTRKSPTSPRAVKHFPAIYEYYAEDPAGTQATLDGKMAVRRTATTFDLLKASAVHDQDSGLLTYESDIPPEAKVLATHFAGTDTPLLTITFLDIEVDYDEKRGFSSTTDPYAPINAVALYHYRSRKSVVIAVPPPSWDVTTLDPTLSDSAEIRLVESEAALLLGMLAELDNTDIISTWNGDFFDMPYIYQRIQLVLGDTFLRRLSFDQSPPPRLDMIQVMGRDQPTCRLNGRVHLDYMNLFKKYEVTERPSYKLEAIAEEVVPHLPKLTYVGSLAKLYQNDFNWFLRYNLRDSEVLSGFEDVLGYIQLATTMRHTSLAQFKDVFGTIRLTDYAIINYSHTVLNVVVPDWVERPSREAQGAYVLFPQIGMHEYIGLVDIHSLYPSAARALNISPEKLVGMFESTTDTLRLLHDTSIDHMLTFTPEGLSPVKRKASRWKQWLRESEYAVSGYGVVFDQSSGNGVIPAILTDWYDQRKQYQALKKQAINKMEAIATKYR